MEDFGLYGVHLTVDKKNLNRLVKLNKSNTIEIPKGVSIIEKYVWDKEFVVIIIDSNNFEKIKEFSKQFIKYSERIEIGEVTRLEELSVNNIL
jgi:hypothetical protein